MTPLLQPAFDTPHNTYPFPDISVADIDEAVQHGLEQEKEEIDAIAHNPAAPTFDNTILPLAESGALLERATTLMYNQLSANTGDELEAVAEKLSPILTEHAADIMQNKALFARVKAVYEAEAVHPTLSEEDRMLLQQTYDGFERSGATLTPEANSDLRSSRVNSPSVPSNSRKTTSRPPTPSSSTSPTRPTWTDCPKVRLNRPPQPHKSATSRDGSSPSTLPPTCRLCSIPRSATTAKRSIGPI